MKTLTQYITEARKFKQDPKGVEYIYTIGVDRFNGNYNALNRKFSDFNDFVQSLACYYGCDVPKIQKKNFMGNKGVNYVVFYMYTKEKWDTSGKNKKLRSKIECIDINDGPYIKFTRIEKDLKTGELEEFTSSAQSVKGYKWDDPMSSFALTDKEKTYWSWFRLKGGENVGWTLIP